jgi:hypothetical protein
LAGYDLKSIDRYQLWCTKNGVWVNLKSFLVEHFQRKFSKKVLAAWSSGFVSACGSMGREIESRQGIRRVVASCCGLWLWLSGWVFRK